MPPLDDGYCELVDNLETAAQSDVVKARRTLMQLIGTVRVKRQAKTDYPIAEVERKTAWLLSETGPFVSMVAEA